MSIDISKQTGAVVTGPPANRGIVSKMTGAVVSGPPANRILVSKMTGFVITGPASKPPANTSPRRIVNTVFLNK